MSTVDHRTEMVILVFFIILSKIECTDKRKENDLTIYKLFMGQAILLIFVN